MAKAIYPEIKQNYVPHGAHSYKDEAAWNNGQAITKNDLNKIENELRQISEEVKNAINGTIYTSTKDDIGNIRGQGDVLSYKLNGLNDIITYSNKEPTNEINKIWITDSDQSQVVVPTFEEYNELRQICESRVDQIDQIKSAMANIITIKENQAIYQQGYYIPTYSNTTNQPLTQLNLNSVTKNNQYKYAILQCNIGDSYYIKGTGGGSSYAWTFVQDDGTVIKSYGKKGLYQGIQIVPQNATKLVLNDNSGAGQAYKIVGENNFQKLQNQVNKLENNVANIIELLSELVPN